MFKAKDNVAPEIMKQLFALKMNSYDLRNDNLFKRRRLNSFWIGVLYRSENMGFGKQ